MAQRNDRTKSDAPDKEQGKRKLDKQISHQVAAKEISGAAKPENLERSDHNDRS